MDGTENKRDTGATQNLPAASANTQGTSEKAQTFTRADIDKAVSDYASRTGRIEETMKRRQAELDAKEKAIQDAEQARELAELEAVKDKPEELSLVQRKQRLAGEIRTYMADKAAFAAEKAEWQSQIAEAKAARFEAEVAGIAAKHQVDGELLKAWIGERRVSDLNLIEDRASLMPKKQATAAHIDSGKTAGGIDFSKLKPEEKFAMGVENERRK